MHELDISHEDLKRSNVLVDGNERPVLVELWVQPFQSVPDLREERGRHPRLL